MVRDCSGSREIRISPRQKDKTGRGVVFVNADLFGVEYGRADQAVEIGMSDRQLARVGGFNHLQPAARRPVYRLR